MARHYGLPYRSGGAFASSKIPDAQAAYESAMSMQATVAGRVNFVLHAAGWLEGGLVTGYEKFVLDCEMLGMMHKLMQPLDLSEHALAMDSIRMIEPGGHHLGTEHTMSVMRTAFYSAELFDYNSAEQWEAEGSKDAIERANAKYKQVLSAYEAPALDENLDKALQEFIAKTQNGNSAIVLIMEAGTSLEKVEAQRHKEILQNPDGLQRARWRIRLKNECYDFDID